MSKDGIGNLSPYSYFKYNPHCYVFAGNKVHGSKKDSVLNAEETGVFKLENLLQNDVQSASCRRCSENEDNCTFRFNDYTLIEKKIMKIN